MAELTQEREWQPIETAPRDGTLILIFNIGESWCFVAGWNRVLKAFSCDLDRTAILYPTHWMPLPEPPRMEKNDY